ncbi:MAG: M24 family metallopeptidase [Alphaproteobacteria bacterium]
MNQSDPTYLARKTPGIGMTDTEDQVNMVRLRVYRLGRVQEELKKRDYGACVLFDPINIRYATGSRNMTVWTLHNAARYAFVPAEGKAVLFEFPRCEHLARGLETIGEVRPATTWYYFSAGRFLDERAISWATEIADLVKEQCGGNQRLALDHGNFPGTRALEALGIEIVEGQEPMERARAIKSADEIACMNVAISVCEAGMARMREALAPGITENELWSILHETNIAMGGEWIETRLLSSGGRTNPWFQECGERVIRPGELVGYDTDLIGPFGYCADISRTYFCGPGKPSDEQRNLYRTAYEQIQANIALLEPGMSFREFSEKSWRIPDAYVAQRYSTLAHGVGMCDEWPAIAFLQDWDRKGGYDGVFEPNMTICIESYVGAEEGAEGVKLEDQVLITDDGVQVLSTFPFEDDLLA